MAKATAQHAVNQRIPGASVPLGTATITSKLQKSCKPADIQWFILYKLTKRDSLGSIPPPTDNILRG